MRASLGVLAALALAQGGDPEAPGPLSGIAGLGGFSTVSRIVFAQDPDHPHRLETVYLFPDRARWQIAKIGGRPAERQIVYRFGEHAYELAPPGSPSKEFQDVDRDVTLLQMELRRAVTMWPDGFDWRERESDGNALGPVRVATVRRRSDGEGPAVGSLVARLDEEGWPARVDARRADGTLEESLAVVSRRLFRDRSWPAELILEKHGQFVWRETIEKVETRVFYVDPFFQPPDRRVHGGAVIAGGMVVHSLDLQGITYRARDLPAETTWADGLRLARAWIEEAALELAPLGLAVDPVPTLELSSEGRPLRSLVRLAERRNDPPEGWTTIDDRPGLALVLEGPSGPDSAAFALLRKALPRGSYPGRPYCRVVARDGAPVVQLYLPLRGEE